MSRARTCERPSVPRTRLNSGALRWLLQLQLQSARLLRCRARTSAAYAFVPKDTLCVRAGASTGRQPPGRCAGSRVKASGHGDLID